MGGEREKKDTERVDWPSQWGYRESVDWLSQWGSGIEKGSKERMGLKWLEGSPSRDVSFSERWTMCSWEKVCVCVCVCVCAHMCEGLEIPWCKVYVLSSICVWHVSVYVCVRHQRAWSVGVDGSMGGWRRYVGLQKMDIDRDTGRISLGQLCKLSWAGQEWSGVEGFVDWWWGTVARGHTQAVSANKENTYHCRV